MKSSDYTVGWVCALSQELAAAEEMLDEEHEALSAQDGDSNIYSFGRVGKHNVVIACLPEGSTGNNSAASVAQDLMRSFRSIRFGLLVGIGGGVPTKTDIRLGDVVVSTPSGTHGGVVQYDFGKAVGEGIFKRTGVLDKPPSVLLSAVSKLKATHDRRDPQLHDFLSAIQQKGGRFASKSTSPGEHTDKLFQASYDHKDENASCEACDSSKLEPRQSRTRSPFIHYGNIASGNQVMRHGTTRDKIAKEGDFICFEMEAAGLMDRFKCLVIRGICDYADSHKNKHWQPYAALVAAAFAKELLLCIPANEVASSISAHQVATSEPAGNTHWLLDRSASTIFTGRKKTLQEMERCLLSQSHQQSDPQRRFVIVGIGGSGKSEVCLKFAETHRDSFWGVFWVDLSSADNAKLAFVQIADACKISDKSVSGVRTWLANTTRSWLLILDNADYPNHDYEQYFPPGNRGCVLFTSRFPECKFLNTVGCETFEKLDADDAVELLLKSSRVEHAAWDAKKKHARSVVDVLAGHALAIVHAGAYVRRHLCTLEEYPLHLTRQAKRLMTFKPVQARSRYGDVYATFEVSAQKLEQLARFSDLSAKAALDLLEILAFMQFQGVNESIFLRAWTYSRALIAQWELKGGWPQASEVSITHLCGYHVAQAQMAGFMSQQSADEFSGCFREARDLLASFSLIAVQLKTHAIYLHPLVHSWARERMKDADRPRAWFTAASILALSITERDTWRNFFPFFPGLQSHIEACASLRPADALHCPRTRECIQILFYFTAVLLVSNSDENALSLAEAIFPAASRVLPHESDDMQKLRQGYAICLSTSSHSIDAVSLLKESLAIGMKTLPASHKDILILQHWLAVAYMRAEEDDEAIELLEEVVKTHSDTVEPSHQYRLRSQYMLACAYIQTQKYERAINLLKEVVEVQSDIYEPSDPERLASQRELASAYLGVQKSKEAIDLLEEVVKIQSDTFEPSHLSRLASQHQLAYAYNGVGRYKEAIELLEEIVEIERAIVQPSHPNQLTSQQMLARVYGRSERELETAEDLIENGVRVHVDTLAADDPDRLASESLLSSIRQKIASADHGQGKRINASKDGQTRGNEGIDQAEEERVEQCTAEVGSSAATGRRGRRKMLWEEFRRLSNDP